MHQPVEITVETSLAAIAPEEWDACACPEAAEGGRPADPFTTHRFLKALEDSRSVGVGTGWSPRYLVARAGGETVAVAPLYAKQIPQPGANVHLRITTWACLRAVRGAILPKAHQIAVALSPRRRAVASSLRPGY